jgi:hypothetical protein
MDRADRSQNIPLSQIKHEVATLDAQPSGSDGLIVMVTGRLLVCFPTFLPLCL